MRSREEGDANERYFLDFDGEMKWGGGTNPTDVTVSRAVSGSLRNTGSYEMQTMMIEDGITAPTLRAGYGRMYIDAADGDLKIIFSNGFVKTIVTDS
jgi:hypothetical protein